MTTPTPTTPTPMTPTVTTPTATTPPTPSDPPAHATRGRRGSWWVGGLLLAMVAGGPAGCRDLSGPSTYEAAAVFRGTAVSELGQPITGAEVSVAVHRDGCDGVALPTAPSEPVHTDESGAFVGRFGFLTSGALTVPCTDVAVVGAAGGDALADTTLVAPIRFDASASDTVTVALVVRRRQGH